MCISRESTTGWALYISTMTKLKTWSIFDIIKKIRKPTPPPTRYFQDETKNVKKDRKDTKAKLKKEDWGEDDKL